MSTKSTITYGKEFHLYTDCFDEAHVWLSLDQPVEFEANPHAVTVRLPLALWEYLRTFTTAETDLADKTDAELRALAAERLAATARQYREDRAKLKGSPRRSALRVVHQHTRERLRDPAKALRELVADLHAQRAQQRLLLKQIEHYRRYPALSAARQRRKNRRIEQRRQILSPGNTRWLQPAKAHSIDPARKSLSATPLVTRCKPPQYPQKPRL